MYPPMHHMLRDLRVEFEHGDGESRAWIPAQAHTADAYGNVRLGVIATLVDVIGGGLAALAGAPGWIATADLDVHRLRPVVADGTTMLEAHGRVLRAGRTTVVIECGVHAQSSLIAMASMTFAILERRDSNPTLIPSDGLPVRHSMALEGSCLVTSLLDALAIAAMEPGVTELNVHPYVVNSLGAVQGGALATLVETAVGSLDPSGPRDTVDLSLSYLSLAKVGPIRAVATPIDGDTARFAIIDTGTGRVTTAGTARTEVRR